MADQMAISPDLSKALGGGFTGDLISNSLIIGGGAFAVSALARIINQARSDVSDYGGVPMEQHLNTTMRDPVFSSDMTGLIKGYKAKEEPAKDKKKSKQVTTKKAHTKQAATKQAGLWDDIVAAGDWIKDTYRGIKDTTKHITAEKTWDPKNLLLYSVPVGTAVLAALAGHKMMDNVYDKSDSEALSKEQTRLSKLHKQLIMARALNRRGALSNEGLESIMKESDPIVRSADRSKTANFKDKEYGTRVPMGVAGLLLAVAATLGAVGGYSYSSARNDRRLKYKAIKDGLSDFARDNSLMRTIDQKITTDDDVYKDLSKITASSKSSPRETPMVYNPVSVNI